MKTVRVILSPEAEEVYRYLNEQAPNSKNERMILNAIHKKMILMSIMAKKKLEFIDWLMILILIILIIWFIKMVVGGPV